MPYRIKKPARVAEELRRLTEEQIDRALAELDDEGLGQSKTVHQVRKRCKKVRAVLRLGRGVLDHGGTYKRENAWFRDAARELSSIRDADALIETYDRVMDHFQDQVSRREFGPVRRKLTLRRAGAVSEAGQLEERLANVGAKLREGRERVAGWAAELNDVEALLPGFSKTYRRARKGMAAAYKDPDPAKFHEWRKRVKYHWYHCRLLKEAWPEVMKARIDALDQLADLLGDEHDLSVFRQTLQMESDRFGNDERAEALVGLMAARQAELREQARPPGRRLLAEKPKHLARRVQAYWSAWEDA